MWFQFILNENTGLNPYGSECKLEKKIADDKQFLSKKCSIPQSLSKYTPHHPSYYIKSTQINKTLKTDCCLILLYYYLF